VREESSPAAPADHLIHRDVPTSSVPMYSRRYGEEAGTPDGAARRRDNRFEVRNGSEDALASWGRGGSASPPGVQGAAGGIGDRSGSVAAVPRDRGLRRFHCLL